ncbi:hypothetical protein ACQP2P_30385 [Dactylosporangium sp. CA-139114]|uniref:hypothetical protein n=1 Tax=Dactylosporangium sp. CA-139114 TaxID=3239931 RepID=UPI003D98C579
MTTFPVGGLDLSAAGRFRAGRLGAAEEAALAGQVAYFVGQSEPPCTPIASCLQHIMEHVGGDEALLAWLDRFPGRPRLVTRALELVALLDRYGDCRPLVAALRRRRVHTPDPPALAERLPPETDESTLPSLGGEIKARLGDDDPTEAALLALDTARLLADLAPAMHAVPGLGELEPLAVESVRALETVQLAVQPRENA